MLNFWMKMTKQPCWISEWKWPSSHVPSTLLDRKHPLLWGQRLWITNLLNTLFKAFSDPRVFLTLICYCIGIILILELFTTTFSPYFLRFFSIKYGLQFTVMKLLHKKKCLRVDLKNTITDQCQENPWVRKSFK
jgi:hypothetical protein